jgi:hypothetical protein
VEHGAPDVLNVTIVLPRVGKADAVREQMISLGSDAASEIAHVIGVPFSVHVSPGPMGERFWVSACSPPELRELERASMAPPGGPGYRADDSSLNAQIVMSWRAWAMFPESMPEDMDPELLTQDLPDSARREMLRLASEWAEAFRSEFVTKYVIYVHTSSGPRNMVKKHRPIFRSPPQNPIAFRGAGIAGRLEDAG